MQMHVKPQECHVSPHACYSIYLQKENKMDLETLVIQSSDTKHEDVAPPIHMSTTFRYPSQLIDNVAFEAGFIKSKSSNSNDICNPHIYARETCETRNQCEKVLGHLENGMI